MKKNIFLAVLFILCILLVSSCDMELTPFVDVTWESKEPFFSQQSSENEESEELEDSEESAESFEITVSLPYIPLE